MKYSIHPEAEEELFAAAEYYESCEPKLGSRFSAEVNSAILNIFDFPQAWPFIDDEHRRCQINHFPFGIIYSVCEGEIYLLAVMHLHRDPDYWRNRDL